MLPSVSVTLVTGPADVGKLMTPTMRFPAVTAEPKVTALVSAALADWTKAAGMLDSQRGAAGGKASSVTLADRALSLPTRSVQVAVMV